VSTIQLIADVREEKRETKLKAGKQRRSLAFIATNWDHSVIDH